MNSQTPIINVAGDYEETILRLAAHLGRDKVRRAVFDIIYGRGSKPRSKKQIAEMLGKSGSSAQVVQNALDHLAKHHLIVRLENGGRVKDRSRWVYVKDNSVRAHRARIVRYADNPAAADKVPTKRRPNVAAKISLVKPAAKGARPLTKTQKPASSRAKLRVALLVTNPDSRASLQTGVEARYIQEGIQLGGNANDVDLKIVPAPTLDTLLDTLNTYRPDVLHFSGHGGGQALVFDNERAGEDGGTVLDFDIIDQVLQSTSIAPRLIVLVACDTVQGADRFLATVPAVIAMSDSIDDEAACEFSKRFYRSISSGETLLNSLNQAKLVLKSKSYSDADLPTLLVRDDKLNGQGLI